MKILDKTKSLSTLASSTTNGLGNINPISCIVTEELNGGYEAEVTLLTTDKYYSTFKSNGLAKILVGDGTEQIFRVYQWGEEINQTVTVKLQHITYDLSKVIITPFSATGAVNVKTQLLSHVLGTYPFTMSTDISNTTSVFTLDIPRSWRECLGGYEGSLLDVFRGEYEYNNLEVKMLARRGADNGVRIAYGKNLTDFQQEQNNENVFDAVYGYAVVDDVCYEASGIYNKTGATVPRVLRVDFSNKYESGDVPTGAELLAYATTYATDNDIEVPSVNIKISFIPLWQTDEYKSILQMERVKLGDTVHVYFEKLGVTASARVIKTVWNSLIEKYDSVELGDARANLNTVINQAVDDGVSVALEDLDVDVGWLDKKVENMAELIANGMGLHITIDSAGRIFLHNEDTLAGSQYQYEITSNGFMLSDDYGQTWNSGWDISGNAVTNSLSTITLKALEIYGSYIEGSQILFGDSTNKYIIAQVYNDGVDDIGVTFDGSGYVRFRPQEQFIVNNLNSNGDLLNEFVMGSSGTYSQPFIVLKNYDHLQNYILANAIEMDAGTNTSDYNKLEVANYETGTGTSRVANRLFLTVRDVTYENNAILDNMMPNESRRANRINLRAYNYTMSGVTYTENVLSLYNYKTDAQNVANQIQMSAQNNAITLTNMSKSATTTANKLDMRSTNVDEEIKLINYKKGHATSIANQILMKGYPMNTNSANELILNNIDVDGDNIADYINMYKSSSVNKFEIGMNRGGTLIARMYINRTGTGASDLGAYFGITTNNTYGYKGANVSMTGAGNVAIDGENAVYIACSFVQPVYINNHKITFSGGYVRYS